ncbi:hypothetical protein R5O29_16095 (plasmid) [Listeria monocytogenes]|nr:hypothetical protein R5O29_16095 [Listeria monocytogenes]
MKYRYEYLSDLYDNSKSINDVKTICTHSEVNPDSLTIKNFTVLQAIREEQRQAENARLKQKSLKREKKVLQLLRLMKRFCGKIQKLFKMNRLFTLQAAH